MSLDDFIRLLQFAVDSGNALLVAVELFYLLLGALTLDRGHGVGSVMPLP